MNFDSRKILSPKKCELGGNTVYSRTFYLVFVILSKAVKSRRTLVCFIRTKNQSIVYKAKEKVGRIC